ncbi:Ger(x)C family spore germination protein [Ruminiclostridium cellobioparum]|uniref:Germination protein, Ger(X)C family n=1 Tax=Ruminiclostridium cellobioparum subsp. termitidis CT1112 TaxID=1195236 RepID=S0FN73_RUMCE|nr:Ger(x)C family spore germination protein [Ruminiclostridium cellobioparum]EMS73317.1 germination protein, Ger(x)C family [Ruminiclostridium cellobioparum subsp. termitidis CT1112]
MRRILALILILSCLPALTACYDALEVDDWAYVYTMGVDKGISNKLRITVQLPTMKSSGGGIEGGGQSSTGSENKDFVVISLDCPTFYTGVNMINSSLSRKINYSHSKYFVVSEDIAKEGMGNLMSAFVRDRQIRRTMHMIVVKGKTSDFIKEINPVLGTALSKTQEGMMNMEKVNGFFDDNDLGSFIDDIKSHKIQPVSVLAAINDFSNYKKEGQPTDEIKSAGDYYAGELPRNDGNKTEYLGTAIFNAGKMVGEFNGDETRALLMIKGEYETGSYVIHDPYNSKLLDTIIVSQQKKPDIKIDFKKEGKPDIEVKVFLEGEIQALQSTVNYESMEYKPILENKVEAFLKEQIDKSISKALALNSDVFGFGEKASMKFSTIQDWEEYKWLEKFKDSSVKTEVQFVIRRTGTLIKTNPTKDGKQ